MELILKYFPNLSQIQTEQFSALAPLYREWNQKINVISRSDIDNLYPHHVLHSLAIAKYLGEDTTHSFIDVGTGGGFPGIPLAIMFPRAHFLLADSIAKKIKVVEAIAQALGLQNITTYTGRIEESSTQCDFIVSRAVTQLDKFIPWVKGKYTKAILYLKGGNLHAEIQQAAARCRFKMADIQIYDIQKWFNYSYFEDKKVLCIPPLRH